MAGFLRWKLVDPTDSTTYQFFPNPNAMTSPFPTRNIAVLGTSAIDGQVLLNEGFPTPASWTFSGDCLDYAQYEALRSWCYDRLGRRLYCYDHYGRMLTIVLKEFNPVPKRSVGKYWRHTYTVTALCLSVGAPTVTGEPGLVN